jgi:hypothetical protein
VLTFSQRQRWHDHLSAAVVADAAEDFRRERSSAIHQAINAQLMEAVRPEVEALRRTGSRDWLRPEFVPVGDDFPEPHMEPRNAKPLLAYLAELIRDLRRTWRWLKG